MATIEVTPKITVGQKVRYAEDGVIACIYGVVKDWRFSQARERIEYLVSWTHGVTDWNSMNCLCVYN